MGSAIAKTRGECDTGVLAGGTIPDRDPRGGVSGHVVKPLGWRILKVGDKRGDVLSAPRVDCRFKSPPQDPFSRSLRMTDRGKLISRSATIRVRDVLWMMGAAGASGRRVKFGNAEKFSMRGALFAVGTFLACPLASRLSAGPHGAVCTLP